MDSTLRGFAIDELERARGTARRTLAIGMFLALFALGYLSWLRSAVASLVTPESLTDLATGVAMATIPKASAELESQLTSAAPALADSLANEAVDAIGYLRTRLESHVSDAVDTAARGAAADLAAGLRDEIAKTPKGDPAARTGKAVGALLAALDKTAAQQTSDKDLVLGGEAFKGLNDSVRVVRKLDADLKSVLDGKKLSREQQLEKKLIQTWLAFVH